MENKTALELVLEERKRQIEVEGYSLEHDDKHDGGEIAFAAACYATHPRDIFIKEDYSESFRFERQIPFDEYHIRPDIDELECAVKGAALMLAEVERLIRLKNK